MERNPHHREYLKQLGNVVTLKAKPGYAVGAISVMSGLGFDGIHAALPPELYPRAGHFMSYVLAVHGQDAALDLLTVDEVAAMLRTSRKAIYHRIARGQIPAVRLGRSVFIRRGDLATCLVTGE